LTSIFFKKYMYKVWHILDSLQNFSFLMFSIGSSLFFIVLIMKNFYSWGHHSQIVSWKIPRRSGLLTTKAPRTDGENYGASEEGSLFKILQTLANMWSFSRYRFLEGNIDSLWYEFKVKDVDRKALDVRLFLCLGQAEVVMAQDVEWVCCSMGGQKIPQAQVF